MQSQEMSELAETLAVTQAAVMFQSLAIVGALAEQRLVDPLKVAAWAETLATGQGLDLAPKIREGIAAQLTAFAVVLRSMTAKPPGSGNVRQ